MRTVGQVSALKLQLDPGLTWALEVGAALAFVARTWEELRFYIARLDIIGRPHQQQHGYHHKAPNHDQRARRPGEVLC